VTIGTGRGSLDSDFCLTAGTAGLLKNIFARISSSSAAIGVRCAFARPQQGIENMPGRRIVSVAM
jgi:hypothetical protein